jgi:hypothetical protein
LQSPHHATADAAAPLPLLLLLPPPPPPPLCRTVPAVHSTASRCPAFKLALAVADMARRYLSLQHVAVQHVRNCGSCADRCCRRHLRGLRRWHRFHLPVRVTTSPCSYRFSKYEISSICRCDSFSPPPCPFNSPLPSSVHPLHSLATSIAAPK